MTGAITPVPQLPDLDPTALILLGRTRRPIAVSYEQGETMRLVPLSPALAPAIERMQKQFAGYTTRIMDTMPDGKTWLLWIGNSCLPGAYVLFNHETSASTVLAFSHDKALTEDRFAPGEYFTFPRRDGGRLSARLWRPREIAQPPLIVMCPGELPTRIVRDLFDADVQAFVAQGFAVLQTNTRNSWAFGKQGRQLPQTQWIGSLQEDMEDAVKKLTDKKIVDGSRVTLFGDRFGAVLTLQVAARSTRFSAVATVNVPREIHRDDLIYLSPQLGSNPLAAKLGGWFASEKFAKELSPILVVPNLPIPALYFHNEDSIRGRPIETGRDIAAAAKKAKAPARTAIAYSWSQYRKPPTKVAQESAEISFKTATFFNEVAAGTVK